MKSNARKSNEQFIRDSVELHGEQFGYDKVEYVNSKTRVILLCKTHQDYFSVAPSDHLSQAKRVGCPRCSKERKSDWCRSNVDEFICKANVVQKALGRSFDYSKVVYKNARQKVDIGCNTCGVWFKQTPYAHTKGHGCKNCKNIGFAKDRSHTKEEFVAAASKVDFGRYCYDFVIYKNARTYVDIVCKTCGNIFKKKPTEILNGKGCRCHTDLYGYRPEDMGKLYILNAGNVTKVGITNGEPKDRAKVISKSFGKEFKVVAYYPMDGKRCTDLETLLLNELRKIYKSPDNKFDGYTECFYDVDNKFIYRQVEILSRKLNDKT